MASKPGEGYEIASGGASSGATAKRAAARGSHPELTVLVWCPARARDTLRSAVPAHVEVSEVVARSELVAGHVYLAPRDRRLAIEDHTLVVGGVERAPFDALLRSLAERRKDDAIAIVLAGQDRDGSLGIKRVMEAGGLTIVEQPDGSEDELTRAAIESGLIDFVLPQDQIAEHVLSLRAVPDLPIDAGAPLGPELHLDALRDILVLLRVRSGHDFSSYKRATLVRENTKQKQNNDNTTHNNYHAYLREHPIEISHLLRDFLI